MKIGLLNLEPKYKNLALEKIRLYYSQKGDSVEDYFALNSYDKVYASSIFTFTRKTVVPQGAICGGTGFDLTTILPPEIEPIKPHLNFGFTSRGCPNKCPFCIVHAKEGGIRITGTLCDLWDGLAKLVVCFDNNVLALPDHFFSICQEALDHNLTVDWNQGLDHRRLTKEVVVALKRISHKEYRLAFDSPAYYDSVDRAINLLKSEGINRCLWYVLVGYNTTFQEDLDRVRFLKEHGQRPFVMRYTHKRQDYHYMALANWCNHHAAFAKMTFEQFCYAENYSKLVKLE